MSALFACSKCFSRHPFEELSQGQQLCKVSIAFDKFLASKKGYKCFMSKTVKNLRKSF